MMRILLLAPTASSLYSRAVAHLVQAEPGMDISAAVVRGMFNWRRLRSELRRDGPRLVKKVREKLILGEDSYDPHDPETMRAFIRGIGMPGGTLTADARRFGFPCLVVPDHNHPRVLKLMRRERPDLVVFTGGGLLRTPLLDLAGRGVLNCHSGILPRYRGMDVVEWPLLEPGEPAIGLTTHWMDAGVDTGPILLQLRVGLRPGDSFAAIRRRMEPRMPELVLQTLRGLRDGSLEAQPQDPQAGRQYFVMHPRLQAAAAIRLRRLTGETGPGV